MRAALAQPNTGVARAAAKTNRLENALREVNNLQHRMAIELDAIPQQPRIEYWTRKIEKVCCDALAPAAGDAKEGE